MGGELGGGAGCWNGTGAEAHQLSKLHWWFSCFCFLNLLEIIAMVAGGRRCPKSFFIEEERVRSRCGEHIAVEE